MEVKKPEDWRKKYDYVGPFIGGLARVQDKDEKWFHVDLDGVPAYKEKYDYVSDFSGGFARVTIKGRGSFRIGRNGQIG